jgi:mono/diheme cytochrome c family protein|tara:strand:- start:340 stop:690 length:351 start_codon:yes stop_codon:yes gene_type:complete
MPSRIILPVIIIGGLLLTSCGGQEAAPTPAPTPQPSAVDAEELYTTNCALCHGADQQGVSDLGPALTSESLAALSDTEIRDTISEGRPNTAMAPFKGTLSPEEIDALTQSITSTPH